MTVALICPICCDGFRIGLMSSSRGQSLLTWWRMLEACNDFFLPSAIESRWLLHLLLRCATCGRPKLLVAIEISSSWIALHDYLSWSTHLLVGSKGTWRVAPSLDWLVSLRSVPLLLILWVKTISLINLELCCLVTDSLNQFWWLTSIYQFFLLCALLNLGRNSPKFLWREFAEDSTQLFWPIDVVQ